MAELGTIIFLTRENEPSGERTRATLLEPLGVSTYLTHLVSSLQAAGVGSFLVACHAEDEGKAADSFPEGTVFTTTGTTGGDKTLSAFLERFERVAVFTAPVYFSDAACGYLTSGESLPVGVRPLRGTGVFRTDTAALLSAMTEGEEFFSALSGQGEELQMQSDHETRTVHLWDSRTFPHPHEGHARTNLLARHTAGGVRILCPENTFFDPRTVIGEGTTLLPGTILRGRTTIGANCEIGPNSMITDCTVGDGTVMNQTQALESKIGNHCNIGPFTYIRPNCILADNAKVGDFVELKNSTIGKGTKVPHLTYVGDSDVGAGCNFGCGSITVNYDGLTKERCVVEDNAFIGCNSNLVAPVRVGSGAYIAAGSTITIPVPPNSLAIGRTRQEVKKDWAKKKKK
jgi:N-acetylglucosamine-1-phosphate uridyltransferase (contains nucleotidyltransferase and I-patch acetyltransferase domains)